MSYERFTIKVVGDEEKWLSYILNGGWPTKVASSLLGIWTTQPLEDPWVIGSNRVYIYINEVGMKKYGFPENAISCKIAHETAEVKLHQEGLTPIDAHIRACKTELETAQEFGILTPYIVAEWYCCYDY